MDVRAVLYCKPLSPQIISHHYTNYFFSKIWIFIELLFVYFFYVETRGPTLEELARIFDGEGAEVAHLDMATVEKQLHEGREPYDEKTAIETNTSTV